MKYHVTQAQNKTFVEMWDVFDCIIWGTNLYCLSWFLLIAGNTKAILFQSWMCSAQLVISFWKICLLFYINFTSVVISHLNFRVNDSRSHDHVNIRTQTIKLTIGFRTLGWCLLLLQHMNIEIIRTLSNIFRKTVFCRYQFSFVFF